MSVILSGLVLVLLCSFHACNARSLGVVNKEQPSQEFHSKEQEIDEKLNDTGVSIQHDKKYSLPDITEGAKEEDKSKEVIMVSSESKDRGSKDDTMARVTDAAQSEPSASASWRVPNKKREDPEPGFNLDYLPPKTHPPSHN